MRVMAVIVGAVVAYASYYAVVQNTCKVDPPITDSAAAIENVKWKIYALVGLPPEKWSSLMYGFESTGGRENEQEETHG
jgi:hypothetical protein